MKDEFLSEKHRAEDILLGSLGFGEEAKIIEVKITSKGYRGIAQWKDGEKFDFECTEEVDDLQLWALNILRH